MAICICLFQPKSTSVWNSFEVIFPVVLLVLVAVGYGRVTSTLQAGDAEPAIAKIVSPTNNKASVSTNPDLSSDRLPAVTTLPSFSSLSSASSGIGSDLAESENSDSTDSEEDSGNSSSSSDETHRDDLMFGTPNPSAPATPLGVSSLMLRWVCTLFQLGLGKTQRVHVCDVL